MEIKFSGEKGLNGRCEGMEKKLQRPACSLLCAQEELADEQLLVELGFDSNHTKSGAVGRWKEGLDLWLGDAHAQRPRVH